jgi:hypothetical protein
MGSVSWRPPEVFLTVPASPTSRVTSIQMCIDAQPCEAMYDGRSTRPPGPDGLIERWWLPTELHTDAPTRIRVVIDDSGGVVDLSGSFKASRHTFGGHCNPHLAIDLRYDPTGSSLVEQSGSG